MAPDTIEREVLIDAPVERVWSLITEAEHVGRWFGDAGAEIDLRPGGAMSISWEKYGAVRARVEAVEAPTRFAYRWAASMNVDGELGEGNSTLVEFTLAEDGAGTRLRVVERGFATLDRSEEERLHKHADNTDGWRQELDELAVYARQSQSAAR